MTKTAIGEIIEALDEKIPDLPELLVLIDPIASRFVLSIGSLLAVAGLLLLVLGRRTPAAVWQTYRGWLVMAPLVLGCVLAGRLPTIVAVTILAGAGFREYARATGLARDRWLSGAVYLGIGALGLVAALPDPRLGQLGWYGLFMAMPVYLVALILLIPIVRDRVRGQLQAIALAILGVVYFGWMLCHLAVLANAPQAIGYLLFLAASVAICDVVAYTAGRFLGRRRLRATISPNKTIAGSVAALLVGLALPWILGFALPHFGLWPKIWAGLIVGVGGQLGDLTISVIKRDLGIKDMGTSIPGHGGVLDRIDSLLFTAPLFFHLVRWFYGLGG